MIELILKNANKAIDSGVRPVDALKTCCNQCFAYVKETMACDGKGDNTYDIVALNGYEFPCCIQDGKWVLGWI